MAPSRSAALPLLLVLAACSRTGPQGTQGTPGDRGPDGERGAPGPTCVAPDTLVHATVTVSAPANGSFFVAGEAPRVTLVARDDCDAALVPTTAVFGTAELFVSGPGRPLETRSASKLLNSVAAPFANMINLLADNRADRTVPAQQHVAPDGTLTYALRPVSDEAPGTYAAAVWLKLRDGSAGAFVQARFQVGTATVDALAAGPDATSTCLPCHAGAGGRVYMMHAQPTSFAPLGNLALDASPSGCKACHNVQGYSPNTFLRKVHGVHRGARQLAPGAAHPDYGQPAVDATLADFQDVLFPADPGGERECVACHVNDAWRTRPSRAGCGTCHDNVFFDTGVLDPPRVLGSPLVGSVPVACAVDADCAPLLATAACNAATGLCESRSHVVQASDAACGGCHTGDAAGTIAAAHAVPERDPANAIAIVDATVTGATAAGAFQVGDEPAVLFRLADASGAPIVGGLGSTFSYEGFVFGPTFDPQRVATATKAQVTYDAVTQLYRIGFPAWPALARPALNAPPAAPVTNAPGAYTLALTVRRTYADARGNSHRAVASFVKLVRFQVDATAPALPREVVLQGACDACHVGFSAHGGGRTAVATCQGCHTAGAEDRAIGAVGASCDLAHPCGGASGAFPWEECQSSRCVTIADPTPGLSLELGDLVHAIHFARRRLNGYPARLGTAPLPAASGPIRYAWGFRGTDPYAQVTFFDHSSALISVDARECKRCHADTAAVCDAGRPCGVGQECAAGRCANVGWQRPSARACLSCHASAAAWAHAQSETVASAVGPIEACAVCHGPGAAYAVEAVHDMSSPRRIAGSRVERSYP